MTDQSRSTDTFSVENRCAAIILAAGRGTRMGGEDGPKQYRRLGETTVLQRTIEAFTASPLVNAVLVVIHKDDRNLYDHGTMPHDKLLPPVTGGETRQHSGLNGLRALRDHQIKNVLIHDAARPLVDAETISRVLEAIQPGHCVIPALPVADTLKKADNRNGDLLVAETVPRDDLYSAQTPQGFDYEEILSAHEEALASGNTACTDDAAVGEAAGLAVKLVEGGRQNIKITTENDLDYMNNNNILEKNINVMDVRTGNGYDVHRLVKGDGVILGGVRINAPFRLDGHSDADVALHALTDALLGAIAGGDIGSHFPPSDPRWKGASSDRFLAHACELVCARGGTITNLDVTIICEQPKIGPHRDAMRESIARITGLDTGRVSVKATTHERIGTLGRNEGIAASATATVVMT